MSPASRIAVPRGTATVLVLLGHRSAPEDWVSCIAGAVGLPLGVALGTVARGWAGPVVRSFIADGAALGTPP